MTFKKNIEFKKNWDNARELTEKESKILSNEIEEEINNDFMERNAGRVEMDFSKNMDKSNEIYFPEEQDENYIEYINAKNVLKSKYINLLYEKLVERLSDNGSDLKTRIGESNFRKYILEINDEKEEYSKKLDKYIESNTFSKDKSIMLKIIRERVQNLIYKFHKEYTDLIKGTGNKKKKAKNKINDYFINITDTDKFLEELKEAFKEEEGQKIRAVIEVLIEEKMLLIGQGKFKGFIELLRSYLNRDIGTYSGIQNKTVNWEIETDHIRKKLNPLIDKHKASI